MLHLKVFDFLDDLLFCQSHENLLIVGSLQVLKECVDQSVELTIKAAHFVLGILVVPDFKYTVIVNHPAEDDA